MPTFRSTVLTPAVGMSQRVFSSAAAPAPAAAPKPNKSTIKPVAGPTRTIQRQRARGSSSCAMDIAIFLCLIYLGHFYVAPAVGPLLADAFVKAQQGSVSIKTSEDAQKTAPESVTSSPQQQQQEPPKTPTPKPFRVLCAGKYRLVQSGYLEQECAKFHSWAQTCAPHLQLLVHGLDNAASLGQSFDATILQKLPVEPLPWMGSHVVLDVGADTDSALVPRPIPKELAILVHTDAQKQIIPVTRKVYFVQGAKNPQTALLEALGYPHKIECS